MGGNGSGNFEDRWNTKTIVEECCMLDVNKLARDGNLRAGASGVLSWPDQDNGEHLASARFSTSLGKEDERIILLSYRLDDPENIVIPIRLQTTKPYYGGLRWWFTCPLVIDNVPCNQRVTKLHLPPDSRYFGCRSCHDLTYQSCRGSREMRWFFRQLKIQLGQRKRH